MVTSLVTRFLMLKISNEKMKKIKINIDEKVICTSCGEFSGWTNDDLVYIKGDRNLKCQNCKKVCIEVKCENAAYKNHDAIIEEIKNARIQARKELFTHRSAN